MNNIIKLLVLSGLILFSQSCKKIEEPIVEFQTSAGTIKIKLYKETPLHRDNFVKLVEDGYFDGLLFHKAMKDFLIETGDPKSKNASQNRTLGTAGPGYTIPAEIIFPKYIHKKGALSAVRLPNTENPEKESNGSQFDIIQGRVFSHAELDTIELDAYNRQLNIVLQRIIAKNRSRLDRISMRGTAKQLQDIQDSLLLQAEKDMKKEVFFQFTAEQRKAYTTIGGAPFMDNEYTVFGEVIEGLDIVKKISEVDVYKNTRPKEDIKIISAKIVEE